MALYPQRVAVVAGVRTPFVKAGTVFSKLRMQELGVHVVRELVQRSKLDPKKLDQVIFSTVLLDPRTPNWAREIVFGAGLPKSVYAHSVTNNCISGLVAITSAANEIGLGKINSAIAGGSESMSNPSLVFGYGASNIFLSLFRAPSMGAKLGTIAKFRPKHFAPQAPSVTEPSTGLTMGQHMEITAQALGITREAEDEIAYLSHVNAARATKEGRLQEEISPLQGVDRDLIIRGDTTKEKLASLKPVFDRKSGKGTLTAGNSSPLTDGASCVLIMSESRAKEEGREALAYITDYEFSAIDPNDGLLMAPAVAVPRMLKRNGLKLEDFDLIEIHEAFGAQVAANIKAWEEGLMGERCGKLDRAKLNVLGGSIAIGHPFAATGGRIVTTLARELQKRKLKRGLISICAAGAMAGAMILER